MNRVKICTISVSFQTFLKRVFYLEMPGNVAML
jgi:hypothetical protein